jgi:hypothetical protein
MDVAPKMKIRPVKNQTPQSSPLNSAADGGIAGDERYVWEVLVPRLLNPGALAIINTLFQEGKALPLRDIAASADLSEDHARYHCQAMESRGVLEVVHLLPLSEGDGDEPSYYFPKPSEAASSPSPPAVA